MIRVHRCLQTLALAALVAFAPSLSAQPYPAKLVKIVVPFTAGSATDILARTVGQKLQEFWGQPVVIDNRPGAGGTIGEGITAKSPADGYTLMVTSAAFAYNPSIYPDLTFSSEKDFVDVAALAGQPNVLVVSPALGIRSVGDLVRLAKEKPGQLNFGSAGVGSGTHINAEKFRLAAGIDVVHIPYKGTPEALTDTMTGRVTFFFSPISAALPHLREGKLVALAVSTAKRSGALKDVPTIAESGVPGFDYTLWVGMFAPAGVSAAVVDKLAADVARAVDTPEVRERLASLGAEAMPMSPAQFAKFVRDETIESGKVIKAAGIRPQ
jgi:tripartite-type tricarboxylate transporter receptor subunit TctC